MRRVLSRRSFPQSRLDELRRCDAGPNGRRVFVIFREKERRVTLIRDANLNSSTRLLHVA